MENIGFGITTEMKIERIREQHRSREKDLLIREAPLTILLNDEELVTLFCSPQKLDYLAVGFLYLAGLLRSRDDLTGLKVDAEKGLVSVRTKKIAVQAERKTAVAAEEPGGQRAGGPGYGKKEPFARAPVFPPGLQIESTLQVEAGELYQLMAALLDASSLFKATGGVHSAALARPDEILFLSEDIGRHNAVDKIAGECILKNISLDDKILLSSGRISSEIVVKGAKLGLPLIVSHSAPTSLSVELAAKIGMTLVGFVRGRRLNIYTRATRITL
ncbi:MAG: formate dehydrogenase accessory sulfurtransferase FdhD [Firmicutes bacterium]|nr:formate dehydrogenase accessory sulfurtransferase FdhD [Bacillota bacterium]